ncbi:hypothetical protein [Xanthobacter flavus]|uniref:hypothetical protein n=1 Tax=Xanthobacter flavus TaxID=281 RepID=UPI003729C6E6
MIEIVRRVDAEPSFKGLPRCLVVEHTLGWITRGRHLARMCQLHLDICESASPISAKAVASAATRPVVALNIARKWHANAGRLQGLNTVRQI